MKGWKENSSLTESMNDVRKWLFRHLLIKSILMYSIFGFIAFVFAHIFIYFNLFYTESGGAQYLLSALVQTQAAIIGIVITLTFIAVQLIFSYAPQAVGVALKKNYDMWVLLFFYGISIFYGLFVLRMIPDEFNGSLSQIYFLTLWGSSVSLECRICFIYCLGVSTFVAIAPYILNTVNFLKPANIIKILSRDTTEYKILRHIKSVEGHKKNRTIPVDEDPFQPIMGIIHGSVMKYDFTTVRCGLEVVTKKAIDIIDIYKYSDDENVPMYFCDHIGRAGRYAMRAVDEESAIEIIGCLTNIEISAIKMPSDKAAKIAAQYIGMIGTFAAESKLKYAASEAAQSLGLVGRDAVKKELGDVAKQAVESLGLVGRISTENGLEDMVQIVASHLGLVGIDAVKKELGDVGRDAVKKELGAVAKSAVGSLGLVGKISAENGLEDAAWQTVPRLGLIGEAAAAKQGFDEVVEQAALHLGRIGRVAALNGFERVVEEAAKSLGSIGKVAVEKELVKRSVPIRAIESLGRVGGVAAKHGLNDATLEAATQLGLIGKAAAEKGLTYSVERAIDYLRRIGEIAVEKKLKTTISQVALRFISIGSVATEKELEFAANRAAEYLAKLTISNKESVENEIRCIGYAFEEKDRKSFDIFVNRYKQYLEELRTQK